MADQGVWFKLWVTSLSDPHLADLSLDDFARWVILGTYIKAHGTAGSVRLLPPARALCGLVRVADFDALVALFHRLPNVTEEKEKTPVSLETLTVVTFRNWSKYQGDYSTHRVRKMRQMKRSKRRREEKREEETRRDVSPIVPTGDAKEILTWLNDKAGRTYRPTTVNLDFIRARLKDGMQGWQLKAIVSRKTREWAGTEQSKYLRPATLFNRTKCEQYLGELPPEEPSNGTGMS